ncbi:hypothetical protein BOTBODRAFT_30487 [Botryobasidium botryosum FD-172 SS1]|uniref:Uncharacterized protein n=1 Tax=Botryobasidium botryosum (strain FD-172 SS1) TaxID=930990 RepID=A0A067N005_BOTB1|nr:hypothetical protein BOTBODRAFT_30487 [Botryobasidium botryosum FD-172 SS1]
MFRELALEHNRLLTEGEELKAQLVTLDLKVLSRAIREQAERFPFAGGSLISSTSLYMTLRELQHCFISNVTEARILFRRND